jgi:polygalacturonase
LASLPILHAQDTRQVSEPRIPPPCATIDARLAAPGGVLSDAAERMADTTRIQAAIDSCAQGRAVVLRPAGRNNVFLAGPLQLTPGVTLVVEANAALFASRNPRDYDVVPGSCGIVGERGPGCKTFITAEHAPGSGIMGDGSIDGRGGAKLIGQDVSWWDLAKSAKILDKNQAVPRLISVRQSNGFTLYRITLRNSPNFHVGVNDTDGFTAWSVKIRTPKTARNTDGIDPSSSTNVTIAYCDIDTGDDNVAIKTGSAPAAHMTIAHNHFYSGHGMSIGSGTAGGVSDIRVTDLSIDGADNGIRIKSDRSRGGLVQRVTYEDVCMRNVANPILMTSMYTTFPGDKIPVYRDILLKNVHSLTPGWVTYLGVDAQHKLGVTLDNVAIDGQPLSKTQVENADVTSIATGTLECAGRFPPFPALQAAPEAAVTVPAEDATLYVAASGAGDYYSIQHAIDVAPDTGAVISIAPGTYRERIKITKPNIHLRSAYDDPKKTVIVFDDSAASAGGTTKSATVEIRADNFTAENLTFANDYNRTHEQLSQGSQALALLVNADRAVFRNMRLLGNQDTVYAASKGCSSATQTCTPARQYFSDCYIEGNVDFIFGDGKAVFENCEIHSTAHKGGYVTAQGKSLPNEDSMYVFSHCKLTAEPGVTEVYLGRPWRPYAAVVFLNTEMGGHIAPAGWHEWHAGETRYLDTAFYAEYNSSGPGARAQERDPHTKFLSDAEAANYETKRFLAGADGWDPTVR